MKLSYDREVLRMQRDSTMVAAGGNKKADDGLCNIQLLAACITGKKLP